MNHRASFDVGCYRETANRVKVALHELPVATSLGILASPDRADLVSLEGYSQRLDVLGCEAGKRDGQVKSHADRATTMVLEAIQLAVGLIGALANQDFQVFQRWCIDRTEAKRTVDLASCLDQLFTRDHRSR